MRAITPTTTEVIEEINQFQTRKEPLFITINIESDHEFVYAEVTNNIGALIITVQARNLIALLIQVLDQINSLYPKETQDGKS